MFSLSTEKDTDMAKIMSQKTQKSLWGEPHNEGCVSQVQLDYAE